MLLGIIIGIVIWQLVVGVAQWTENSEQWWVAPVPCLLLAIVAGFLSFCGGLQNIKAYIYLVKHGINPFHMTVSKLIEFDEIQRKEFLEICKGQYKNSIRTLFNKNPIKTEKTMYYSMNEIETF